MGKMLVWCWKPLRQSDEGWTNYTSTAKHGHLSGQRYQGAVPLPMLRLVGRISKVFPEVHFYVSDYPSKKPDPFLMVSALGPFNNLINGHWDEPDFKLFG